MYVACIRYGCYTHFLDDTFINIYEFFHNYHNYKKLKKLEFLRLFFQCALNILQTKNQSTNFVIHKNFISAKSLRSLRNETYPISSMKMRDES